MAPELVTLKIDGREAKVPKGTNVIEAAKSIGVDIPHYCYHKDLSVVGNCRMCQIQVAGQPKLTIGCNTPVAEGMEVQTQASNKAVADAQAATLEFILINHPLDCTVCDQAGHCKLQDYHFEYNARASRFVEEKVQKVKAVPLGPTVMLDGERCIMCTRCIRFCDEVTKTSEIGMLNRGDQSVIAVSPGRELNNPLSGSVVDLCPVGALTHRKWRFNTRIWFTKQTDAICPGCSTGCNAKVAVRDGQVVQVKARYNGQVNKEWMCDEGRYGFDRFLPKARISAPYRHMSNGSITPLTIADAVANLRRMVRTAAIFVAPDLLLEEYALLKRLLARVNPTARIAVAYRQRTLSEVEKILVSPDYAANFRGAELCGLVSGDLQAGYKDLIEKLRNGEVASVLVIGDRGIDARDLDSTVLAQLRKMHLAGGFLTDAESPLAASLDTVVPSRSILEKSGLLVNKDGRLQYTDRVVEPPESTLADWKLLLMIAEGNPAALLETPSTPINDREFTRWFLASDARFKGLTIGAIKSQGVDLHALTSGHTADGSSVADKGSEGQSAQTVTSAP